MSQSTHSVGCKCYECWERHIGAYSHLKNEKFDQKNLPGDEYICYDGPKEEYHFKVYIGPRTIENWGNSVFAFRTEPEVGKFVCKYLDVDNKEWQIIRELDKEYKNKKNGKTVLIYAK